MILTTNPAAPRDLTTGPSAPTLNATAIPVTGASFNTTEHFYDSLLDVASGATSHNDWQINAGSLDAQNTLECLDPDVAALDATGRLTRVVDGIARVAGGLRSRRRVIYLNLTQSAANDIKTLNSYLAGTVARHLHDQVTDLIASDPTKRDVGWFSSIDHATATYTPNQACWARDVDLSCLSVGTSYGLDSNYSTQRPGTLITCRHILVADHYKPLVSRGDYLRFRTPAGTLRTVRAIGESGACIDQKVIVLSADVNGCNPALVGAPWLTQRTEDSRYYAGGLVLSLNKHRHVTLSIFGNPIATWGDALTFTYPGVSITGQRVVNVWHDSAAASMYHTIAANSDLTGPLVSGDSGSPCFALVGGQPVVLTCWLSSTSGPCTWMGSGGNELLNAMIAEADAAAGISTGYTVTPATNPT